jgi:hypothetical protein
MDQNTWTLIDQIAEREAAALRQARKHRSVWYIHHSGKGVISRDQALFDELLTLHFTTCAFCGSTFDLADADPDTKHPMRHGKHTSLNSRDIDICDQCLYLKGRLVKSAPAVQKRAPALAPM